MKHYAYVDASGAVRCALDCQDHIVPPDYEGLTAVLLEAAIQGPHMIVDGVPIPYVLTMPLDVAKEQQWGRIKDGRRERETATFTLDGMVFDANESKLAGASLDAFMAQSAGEVWEQAWVLADNSVVVLNAAQMIAAGRACKARISSLWAQSQVLRSRIEAATTIDEVEAVKWDEATAQIARDAKETA